MNPMDITVTQGGTTHDISGWKVAGIDERMLVVREAAGSRFDQLELSAQIQRVIVTENRRGPAEELAEDLAAAQRGRDPGGALRATRHRGGDGGGSSRTPRSLEHFLLRHLRAVLGASRPRRRPPRGQVDLLTLPSSPADPHSGPGGGSLRRRITGLLQRTTDELVHRLRGVQHLRRDFTATNGERSIEEVDLDEQ